MTDDFPPTYHDTISGPSSGIRPSLTQQVISARSQHIQTLITTLIIPILENRALHGLSQSTIVLVPPPDSSTSSFSSSSLTPTEKPPHSLVGLADSDESFEQVSLQGPLNTPEFWRQDEALDDLQALLAASIQVAPFYEPELIMPVPQQPLPPRPPPARKSKSRGFFGRRVDDEELLPPTPTPPTPPPPPQTRSRVRVQVVHEDICYRVENEFGLLDTVSRPAVVVRVDTRA
jgi:hypothetical protein